MGSFWIPSEPDRNQIQVDFQEVDTTSVGMDFYIMSYQDAKEALAFIEENPELLEGKGFYKVEYEEFGDFPDQPTVEVPYIQAVLKGQVMFDISWDKLFNDIFNWALLYERGPSISKEDIKKLYTVEKFSEHYYSVNPPESLSKVAEIGLDKLTKLLYDINFDLSVEEWMRYHWKEHVLPQQLEGSDSDDIDEDYLYEIWAESEEGYKFLNFFEKEGLKDLGLYRISQILLELLDEE